MEYKESYITYRKLRSEEALRDVKIAIENNSFNLAENRIYYAIFYLISALALKNGFSTKKHKQLMNWFHKEYIGTGIVSSEMWKIYKKAFDNRLDGDYEDLIEFNETQVNKDFENLKIFIEEIKKLF